MDECREQFEKLTKERDALKTVPMKYRRMQFNAELQDEVTQLQKQLAALAEQNEKMRAFVTKISEQTPEKPDYWSSCGQCEHNSSNAEDLLELPNIATPILNKIKAETLEAFKVELMHLVANGEASLSETSVAVDALEARIDKLTNKERGETR